MKNEIKIGIGVVIIGGLLLYFSRRKTQNTLSNPTATNSSQPSFDREKCAKEYAQKVYPEAKRLFELNNPNVNLEVGARLIYPFSELSMYNHFLEKSKMLTDNADAQFFCELAKKSSPDGHDQFDLATQIKIQNLQKKYPTFNWGEINRIILTLTPEEAVVTT